MIIHYKYNKQNEKICPCCNHQLLNIIIYYTKIAVKLCTLHTYYCIRQNNIICHIDYILFLNIIISHIKYIFL